jgi:hypothetical protein
MKLLRLPSIGGLLWIRWWTFGFIRLGIFFNRINMNRSPPYYWVTLFPQVCYMFCPSHKRVQSVVDLMGIEISYAPGRALRSLHSLSFMFFFVAGKCNRTFRQPLASVTSKFVNQLIDSSYSSSVLYLHNLHLRNDLNVYLWRKWSCPDFKKLRIYCRVRAVIELGTCLRRSKISNRLALSFRVCQ